MVLMVVGSGAGMVLVVVVVSSHVEAGPKVRQESSTIRRIMGCVWNPQFLGFPGKPGLFLHDRN